MAFQEAGLNTIELITAAIGLITAVVEFFKRAAEAGPAPRKTIIRFSIVVVSFLVILGAVLYSWHSDRFLNASLENHDPLVFRKLTSETYRVARIFPNRSVLGDEGNLGDVLDGAKQTFDFQATSANETLKDYAPAIKNALHRGVIVRLLLFDTSDDKTCEAFASSFGQDCAALRNMLKDSLNRLRTIHKDEPNKRLDVRLYKEVPLKGLWIKDATVPKDFVVQVEFHDREDSQRASFRIGRLGDIDGGYAGYLEGQFNSTWALASVVDLSK